MSTQSVLPPGDADNARQRRAIEAVHNATWFALREGDRYTALGRKAVANSFYSLLPMLAEIRKAIAEHVAEHVVEHDAAAAMPAVAAAVAAAGAAANDAEPPAGA